MTGIGGVRLQGDDTMGGSHDDFYLVFRSTRSYFLSHTTTGNGISVHCASAGERSKKVKNVRKSGFFIMVKI